MLEVLAADGVAQELLCGADRLVPRAIGAVRVVLCDAGCRGGKGPGSGGCVGELVASFGVGFLLVGGLLRVKVSSWSSLEDVSEKGTYLISRVAGDGRNSGLDSARHRVDGRLESGGLFIRHVW